MKLWPFRAATRAGQNAIAIQTTIARIVQSHSRRAEPQKRDGLALVEVTAEPLQGRAFDLRRLIRRIQQHELERLLEAKPDLARAVASATRTLPRSIARLKIVPGCPCAVNGPPAGAGRLAQPTASAP